MTVLKSADALEKLASKGAGQNTSPEKSGVRGRKAAKTKNTESTAEDALRGMARSFAVLDLLAAAPQRVVDVTRALDLPWATVHRTLMQLENAQFLRRDLETNRYEIGPRLWHIGSSYLANHRVLKVASPYLARIEDERDFASQIAERVGYQAVAIYAHQRDDQDIRKAQYGYHFPLHCGSKGLALLAYEDPEFIEEYLARDLEKLTPLSVTDPQQLRTILKAVRRDGISMTLGDVQPFTGSLASPIRDANGKVSACVSFVFRKQLTNDQARLAALRDLIVETAHLISIDLGWRPGQT